MFGCQESARKLEKNFNSPFDYYYYFFSDVDYFIFKFVNMDFFIAFPRRHFFVSVLIVRNKLLKKCRNLVNCIPKI